MDFSAILCLCTVLKSAVDYAAIHSTGTIPPL